MIWWIVCFGAVSVTIFAKWYFADNLSRLRQNLSRQHRETLKIKESLQEARKTHQEILLFNKSKEMDILRTRKHIAEMRMQLQNKETKKEKEEAKKRDRRYDDPFFH